VQNSEPSLLVFTMILPPLAPAPGIPGVGGSMLANEAVGADLRVGHGVGVGGRHQRGHLANVLRSA
jgi:hypothetical protein